MNALAALKAAQEAEGRRRMTHWAPQRHDVEPITPTQLAEDFTPYGSYVSARDAVEDFKAGHLGSGAGNALLTVLGLGGILGAVGRGAKRAGKAVNALSEGERLTRAADQAYLLDEPMYRGSNALLEVFDPARRGGASGRRSAKVAEWAHSREDAAGDFAKEAADRLGGKPQVQKLVANKEGMITVNLKGADLSDDDMMNFLLDRKDEGIRVVRFDGVNDSVGKAHPGPVYAILDQGAVRDVDRARFDPAELGRPGLTKALAGLGLSIPFVRSLQSGPEQGKL